MEKCRGNPFEVRNETETPIILISQGCTGGGLHHCNKAIKQQTNKKT